MQKISAHNYGTRCYHFNKQEIEIIEKFCQIAQRIENSEVINENNIRYSAKYFFESKYDEYKADKTCSSYFSVSD